MEQFNETLDKNHQVFTALKKIIQRQQLSTKKQFVQLLIFIWQKCKTKMHVVIQ